MSSELNGGAIQDKGRCARSNVFALLCPQTELGALTFSKM